MKMKRLSGVSIIGILASVILFIVAGVFLVKDGYARDSGIYVSPVISYSLWILLTLCALSLIAFFAMQKWSKKKGAEIASVFLLVVLIIGGLWVTIGWQTSFSNANDILSFDDSGVVTYEKAQSDTGITPTLALYENRQFNFEYDAESSYKSVGRYKISKGKLYLETDDNEYIFVFNIKGNSLVFEYEESKTPMDFRNIPDKAEFIYADTQ